MRRHARAREPNLLRCEMARAGVSDGCRSRVGVVGVNVGAFGAFDGLAIAQLDLDLSGLPLLGLWDLDLQHAAVEVGLDCVGVHAVRQGKRARERAERALAGRW